MTQQFQSIAQKRRRGVSVFTAQPFDGSGVSLYASVGNAVQYRRLKLVTKIQPRQLPSIAKTTRVAAAADPATEIEYTLPAALVNQTVTYDVRRYQDDVENITDNAFTRTVTTDSSGDDVTTIIGTAELLNTELRAGGVVRLRFRYDHSESGLPPVTFAAVRTAGPTTPDDAEATYIERQQIYEIDTPALPDDSGAYTYKITATNGATTVDLLTGITFTPDASGPSAPSSGTAEAW